MKLCFEINAGGDNPVFYRFFPFIRHCLRTFPCSQEGAHRCCRAVRIITSVYGKKNCFFKFSFSIQQRQDFHPEIVKAYGRIITRISIMKLCNAFLPCASPFVPCKTCPHNSGNPAFFRDEGKPIFQNNRELRKRKGKTFNCRRILLRINTFRTVVNTPVHIAVFHRLFRIKRKQAGPDFRTYGTAHGMHEKFIGIGSAQRRFNSPSVIPFSISIFIRPIWIMGDKCFHEVITG